jgi:tRNA-modifying protein YgfZ
MAAADQDTVLHDGCGLLDRSERGRLALTGTQAREFVNGQVSNDIEAVDPGNGCFATFLTPKGKMLGDLRVLNVTEPGSAQEELLLDTERVALQSLFDLLRRATIGFDVTLHKRTLESAEIALVGPTARTVAGVDELPEQEYANRRAVIGGADVLVVATDLGVDVIAPSEDAGRVRETLEAAGAVPVSEAAVDVVRIEHGRPRYGVDLDETVIPQEAGLNERAVSFTKGCYVGQETVARLHWRGKPNRHLRGLRLSAPLPPGTPLQLGEKTVGTLTSSVASPRYGDIALALVRREAEPGATLQAGDTGQTAIVVDLPFA